MTTTDTSTATDGLEAKEELSLENSYGESDSWRFSRKIFRPLGPPHGMFARCIRSLRRDSVREISHEQWPSYYKTNLDLAHLYKSPNIRAMIYFAAKSLHPQELEATEEISGLKLISLFSPAELSSVIACAYLHRHVAKVLGPELWTQLRGEAELQMETGMWVGRMIPAIGLDRGLMLAAARFFGQALYAKLDLKGFKNHRRILNQKEILLDLTAEEQEWGCNHLQVASLILQKYGFGVSAGQGMLAFGIGGNLLPGMESMAAPWYAAMLWIQSVLIEDSAPVECTGEFMPALDVFAKLQRRVDEINEGEASFDWINKRKEDLPVDLADQICSLRPNHTPKVKSAVRPADLDPDDGPEVLE